MVQESGPEDVPRRSPGPSSSGVLKKRLAPRTSAGQVQLLLGIMRSAYDAATDGASTHAFDPLLPWRQQGICGRAAEKLRSTLAAALDMQLPVTSFFDHATPHALAESVRERILHPRRESISARPPGAPISEPIAIVSMACRFPGGISSPEELWDLVLEGKCAISDLPTDRGWDLDLLARADPESAGTTITRRGGFLDRSADFDADFFEISPREALAMHPEQRLVLETAWEALERAGLVPDQLRGRPVGVYVGAMSTPYGPQMHEATAQVKGSVLTGTTSSVISGRVSYVFGFEGPAITVDTACSASLVAIHLAAQSLLSGECELALAGGVTFNATPGMFTELSKYRGLAPDGLCKAFAAAADGTAWGEGAGMLVLARLSDAHRLGYPVLGLIRGSAINQDGASNGLTSPNGLSQQRLIHQVLAGAGLAPADVDAVEAHGTGTRLGDPIEANSVLATYGQDRPVTQPLWLGSLKSNLGHTQAAAGVGGVIKMVMALRHGILPKTLHVDEPTPHVDWSAGSVRLLTERTEWPDTGRPRRAAVSAFGISGTNAHAIIEQAPAVGEVVAETVPWVVYATSEQALQAQARRLREHMASRPGLDCGDVAWSLATCRSRFPHRALVLGDNRDDFLKGLDAVATAAAAPNVVQGAVRQGRRVAFVFPGYGSQWARMASELMAQSEVFARRMAECEDALAPYCDWSLQELLQDPERLDPDQVDVIQPVLFAVMVSLAEVWKAHGVHPDAVIGHSQGEIAAACVSGVLSLADAAKTVALRSKALARLAGTGAIAAVALSPAETERRIERWQGRLWVAVVNSPNAVSIAGESDALDEAVAELTAEGERIRRLKSTVATHVPLVEPIREEILELLAEITPQPAIVPFYSTVTGGYLEQPCLDAGYWYRNLREQVRFSDAVRDLLDEGGPVTFVEVSPHPLLVGAVEEIADESFDADVAVLGTLRRDSGGQKQFVRALAEAHAQGVEIDWDTVFARLRPRPRQVDLPTYAFQRRQYWLNDDKAGARPSPGLATTGHPLVSTAVDLPETAGLAITGVVSAATVPWLADHTVGGAMVVPGTVFVELAVEAGARVGCGEVSELVLEVPLVLPGDGAVQLHLTVGAPDGTGGREFAIHSRPAAVEGSPWTRHGGGTLAATSRSPAFDLTAWPPPGAEELDVAGLYAHLSAAGVDYGPGFRAVRAAWRRGQELFADLSLPATVAAHGRFSLHPVLLGAALQVLGSDEKGNLLPFAWSGITPHVPMGSAARVRLVPDGTGGVRVEIADSIGRPVVTVKSVVLRPASAEVMGQARTRAGVSSRPHPVTRSLPTGHRLGDDADPHDRGERSHRDDSLSTSRDGHTRTNHSTGDGRGPRQHSNGLPEARSRAELVSMVRHHTAVVLRHPSGDAIPEDRPFKELGFQSINALELRNSISREIGRKLAATVVFQHPTPRKLAAHLAEQLRAGTAVAEPPAGARAAVTAAPGPEAAVVEIDGLGAEALIEMALKEASHGG
jgi:acyl transferase domain-containing protein